MTPVLILSGGLIVLMAVVEGLNFRRTQHITFLTATHALIAVGYCLPPFLIRFLPATAWAQSIDGGADPTPWGTRLYILDLADYLRLPENTFVTVGIILFGAYVVMTGSYFMVSCKAPQPLNSRNLPVWGIATAGLCLGLVASVAFAIYVSQFDSYRHFIKAGIHIRGGSLSVKWGAFQVLTQITLPAYLFCLVSAFQTNGKLRAFLILAAMFVFCVGFARIMHVGGRIELGVYVLTPIVAALFLAQSRLVIYLILPFLGLMTLLIANLPHRFGRDPIHYGISTFIDNLSDLVHRVIFIVSEFAFPHIVSAHALTATPDPIPFRYFVDIPLGALYMLPNFTGVETLPPMILSLQAKILPWMPVDLFSLGYFSLGTLGVLFTFAAFGALLALFDGWLTRSVGWLGQALRAIWLFYLPFRLFYADPYAALQSGFGLIAGTVIILGLALLAQQTAKRRDRSAPS